MKKSLFLESTGTLIINFEHGGIRIFPEVRFGLNCNGIVELVVIRVLVPKSTLAFSAFKISSPIRPSK